VITLEEVSLGLKLSPELAMVVDLTVEDDHQIAIRRGHGLRPSCKIHNREPPMSEMHSPLGIDEISLGIRPTVGQCPCHSLQDLPVTSATGGNESRDPAHQLIGKFLVCFTR
jgi:hypothetical protein